MKLLSSLPKHALTRPAYFLLIALIFAPFTGRATLHAQTDIDLKLFNGRIIKDIAIIGNKHTKRKVIQRELLFGTGQVFNDSLVLQSKKRLENLWLFNRVEFIPFIEKANDDSVSIIISVTERWYFFPYPVFEVQDRDWNKLTYGFGFAHLNFRGLNQKLQTSVQFGNRRGFKFTYLNPWIGDQAHLFAGVYLRTYELDNYSYDFPEYHFYSVLHFGKYWTHDFMSEIFFLRDHIHVNKEDAHYLASGTQTDVKYGLGIKTLVDHRDLYAYPTKGWYLNFTASKIGFFEPGLDYTQYVLDARKYIPLKPFILAGRIYTVQTQGHLPVYDRVYFGYTERIRGHFAEVYQGSQLLFLGAAVRMPLIKVHYFSFNSPFLPDVFTQNLKFGLNVGLFAEAGQVTDRREQFAISHFIKGFGAGLHFLLPYVEVLRFDIAFDEQLQHQFILEILMPF